MTHATDDELLALAKKATQGEWQYPGIDEVNPDLITAGRDRDGAFIYPIDADENEADNRAFVAAANPAAIIALIERHRAEVERLTRENNNLSAGQKHALESCWAAESALRAERKRVGELEEALEEIASNVTSLGDALDTACNALRRKRAALAGKDAEVTNDQRGQLIRSDERDA